MAAERVQSARGKVAIRDLVVDPGLPRLGDLLMALIDPRISLQKKEGAR